MQAALEDGSPAVSKKPLVSSGDESVDLRGFPVDKSKTGRWRAACFFFSKLLQILAVDVQLFNLASSRRECSTLSTVLHDRACFLTLIDLHPVCERFQFSTLARLWAICRWLSTWSPTWSSFCVRTTKNRPPSSAISWAPRTSCPSLVHLWQTPTWEATGPLSAAQSSMLR